MGKTIAEALRDEGHTEGRVRGHAEGLIEGRVQNARDTLVRQLRKRFGEVPQDIADRIEGTSDLEQLTTWLDQVVTAESVEDMGIKP